MGIPVVVIGGGISGLAAAFYIREQAPAAGLDVDLTVIEGEARPGGKIWSIRDQGFLCEWGPNGFLDNKPLTLDLCTKLGLSHRLLKSRDQAGKRYIYSKGKLHLLPESPAAFFRSDLLSLRGRLRIIGELWAAKAPADRDESLADFARRRLGQEALDKLIGPMVSGIFAGDPEKMSLKSSFPRIAELEAEYGGLIRAMIGLQKQRKQTAAPSGPKAGPAGPGGTLTSFEGGLEDLIHALKRALPDTIRVSSRAHRIEKTRTENAPFHVHVQGSPSPLPARILVLAVPAYAASQLMAQLEPEASRLTARIPYAPLSVIALGYRSESVPLPVDGFGFLIPHKEGKRLLGTLWDSSIFPGRAPAGYVSLRSMAGGAVHPEYALLDENDLVANTRETLREIMGIRAAPDFVKVFRHDQAIPQYRVGHGELLSHLEALLAEHQPGLFITGNAYCGIGINDCVESATRVAEKVIRFLTTQGV